MNSEQSTVNSRKVGFTLIELLLYMGLVAIFVSAATIALLDITSGSTKSSVEQEVQENLRYTSYRIQFEWRNADAINPDSSFGTNLATNPALIVSLTSPSPNNPTEFRVEGGILQIKQGSGGGWAPLTSS
ncbi:MAG: prepilin-type N-terminal cleavage/methylation domain-containing protein, partial [Ignavibacteria bacterium]|nr:prepilin-type N-terminal cleavage/methylation domain-containing protein [Ignavibacteria bacterium]